MINNNYNKNSLEAVTQGKVGGEPARSLYPLRLAKTILLFFILTTNISFSQLQNLELDGVVIKKEQETKPEISSKVIEPESNITRQLIRDTFSRPDIDPSLRPILPAAIMIQNGEIGFCWDAPEPSSGSLLLYGLGILYFTRKRRNK
jgi:hypothetical protein